MQKTTMIAAAIVASLLTSGVAAQVVTWDAPTEVGAGDAIFGAYAIRDGAAYTGHVNVEIKAILDGEVIFSSSSLHEHDGFHPFILTPMQAGELTLTGRTAAGPVSHVMNIRPSAQAMLEGQVQTISGTGSASASSNEFPLIRMDAYEGTLLRSSSYQFDSGITFIRDVPWTLYPQYFQEPQRANGLGLWPDPRSLDVDPPAPANPSPLDPITALLDPSEPDPACGPDVPIILDPVGLSATGAPQFQQHSHIRLAWPGHGQPGVQYALLDGEGVTMYTFAEDDNAIATMLPGAAGNMNLRVTTEQASCVIGIEVLANPAPQGTLEAVVDLQDDSVTVSMSAIDSAGGSLGHYEFDTEVVRLVASETPLGDRRYVVWAGKLHGHGGEVEFTLGGLQPGDYSINVQGSPQDLNSAPVQQRMEGVNAWTFSIAEQEVAKPTPMPFWLALVGLIGVIIRRRT